MDQTTTTLRHVRRADALETLRTLYNVRVRGERVLVETYDVSSAIEAMIACDDLDVTDIDDVAPYLIDHLRRRAARMERAR